MELGPLARPTAAIAHLRSALGLGLPDGLAQEALTMLVETQLARGSMDGACSALRDFPNDASAATRALLDATPCESHAP